MSHQMHLNKSGSGMASKTACGRNVVRTPMSANWDYFKNLPHDQQCAKCAASKQAELNARTDAKAADAWVPVADENAWKDADAKMIAAHKAKQGK